MPWRGNPKGKAKCTAEGCGTGGVGKRRIQSRFGSLFASTGESVAVDLGKYELRVEAAVAVSRGSPPSADVRPSSGTESRTSLRACVPLHMCCVSLLSVDWRTRTFSDTVLVPVLITFGV